MRCEIRKRQRFSYRAINKNWHCEEPKMIPPDIIDDDYGNRQRLNGRDEEKQLSGDDPSTAPTKNAVATATSGRGHEPDETQRGAEALSARVEEEHDHQVDGAASPEDNSPIFTSSRQKQMGEGESSSPAHQDGKREEPAKPIGNNDDGGDENGAVSETDEDEKFDFPTDWGYVIPDPPAINGMDPEFVFSCPSSHPLQNTRVVQADVKRTRAAIPAVVRQHARLETLITNYCQATDTFYRQGLNEILAPFLLLEPENDLKVLIKFHGFFSRFCAPFFAEGFTQMENVLATFDSLILYHFPDLHQELAINDLEPVVYATPWFVTLFASKLDDLRDVVSLWKLYCIRNDPAYVAFIGLAMLKRAKTEILRTDISALPGLLASLTPLPLDEICVIAEELYQQTPAVFTTHIRYQLPWQSVLPEGDPFDPSYFVGWDAQKAAEDGNNSAAEDAADMANYSYNGGSGYTGGLAGSFSGSYTNGTSYGGGGSSSSLSLNTGFGYGGHHASVGVGTSRVVGLSASEVLSMLGSGKKRVYELQMMLIDSRSLADFEDNGRLPSALHCEDAHTLHKLFALSVNNEESGGSSSSTSPAAARKGSPSVAGRTISGTSASTIAPPSRLGGDDQAASTTPPAPGGGGEDSGLSESGTSQVAASGEVVCRSATSSSSVAASTRTIRKTDPPDRGPLVTRKVHLCLISKRMAYESAFRYQIPFVSYVKGGYAALHDKAIESRMEMINHDKEKCFHCAPPWRQQAFTWKTWLTEKIGGPTNPAGRFNTEGDTVPWPIRNHDGHWRCRSGGCHSAVVTTRDNLLYLVEIDPEGQRVGANVRVISKYPVYIISKITSKKSAKEPTRCFYFKETNAADSDILQLQGGSRKPYLGFAVTFESEELAKDCTSRVGEACRRAVEEHSDGGIA
ncbi:unnamed protein product [Amoebophrya sp. A25]|nr:unnamed protein product [Amoebophrya sp. A25]|eukprot:GSA25T00013922001.1